MIQNSDNYRTAPPACLYPSVTYPALEESSRLHPFATSCHNLPRKDKLDKPCCPRFYRVFPDFAGVPGQQTDSMSAMKLTKPASLDEGWNLVKPGWGFAGRPPQAEPAVRQLPCGLIRHKARERGRASWQPGPVTSLWERSAP